MSSTKSATGHLTGAAGAIEAVFSILALTTETLPPTINHETTDPECDLDYIPNKARNEKRDERPVELLRVRRTQRVSGVQARVTTAETLAKNTLVLDGLLDAGSFTQIRSAIRSQHMEAGPAGDGVLTGEGRIDGRRVFVFEQDQSVLGGSLGEAHADSICNVLDLAARFGAPIIGVHRSGGARIQEGVGALSGYARIFARHVRMRGVVPQIALVAGPCAGGAAYGPALMDFVILPRSDAFLFLTGPDVVKEVTGEIVSFEDLGGSRVAERSGLATIVSSGIDGINASTRELLSYLPQRIGGPLPTLPVYSAPDGDPETLVPVGRTRQLRRPPGDRARRGRRLVPRAARRRRAEPRVRLRAARRPDDRHRREPAALPRRGDRHQRVAQGRVVRRAVWSLRDPARGLRRHAGVPARHRAGERRRDPGGRGIPRRVRRRATCRRRRSSCARRSAARTSS